MVNGTGRGRSCRGCSSTPARYNPPGIHCKHGPSIPSSSNFASIAFAVVVRDIFLPSHGNPQGRDSILDSFIRLYRSSAVLFIIGMIQPELNNPGGRKNREVLLRPVYGMQNRPVIVPPGPALASGQHPGSFLYKWNNGLFQFAFKHPVEDSCRCLQNPAPVGIRHHDQHRPARPAAIRLSASDQSGPGFCPTPLIFTAAVQNIENRVLRSRVAVITRWRIKQNRRQFRYR